MPSETYKILNNAADYICLACGTYNCNSGICERCRSIQYGSPEYVASGLARRDKMLATMSPQQYADYIAAEQAKAREEALPRIREREENERRQARDKKAEAARLAVTLPLRARWEQQKKDESTARLRDISRRIVVVFTLVLLIAAAVCAIRFADLGMAALCSGVLGAVAVAGGCFARLRRGPEAPVRPPVSGSSYSRAPRSK